MMGADSDEPLDRPAGGASLGSHLVLVASGVPRSRETFSKMPLGGQPTGSPGPDVRGAVSSLARILLKSPWREDRLRRP